jgi:hypothetical protein
VVTTASRFEPGGPISALVSSKTSGVRVGDAQLPPSKQGGSRGDLVGVGEVAFKGEAKRMCVCV